MKVSVLIPTRNRPKALLRCLTSVRNQTYPDLEILVLDDGSSVSYEDAEVAPLLQDARLSWLRSEEPLGAAGARNVLAEQARGDLLCFLDDDASFADPQSISRLVEGVERHPRAGVLAFKIIEPRPGGPHVLTPYRQRRLRRQPDLVDRAGPVSFYIGCGYAMRRSVFEQCRGYQAALFYGHEELALSYQVLEAHFEIIYLPEVTIHHVRPSEDDPGSLSRRRKLYYLMRNRIVIAYRYLPGRYLPSHLACWIVFYGWRALQTGGFRAYWNGLKDGLATMGDQPRRPVAASTLAYLKAHGGRLWY